MLRGIPHLGSVKQQQSAVIPTQLAWMGWVLEVSHYPWHNPAVKPPCATPQHPHCLQQHQRLVIPPAYEITGPSSRCQLPGMGLHTPQSYTFPTHTAGPSRGSSSTEPSPGFLWRNEGISCLKLRDDSANGFLLCKTPTFSLLPTLHHPPTHRQQPWVNPHYALMLRNALQAPTSPNPGSHSEYS